MVMMSTHHGMGLTILILIPMIVIVVSTIRRMLNVKQFICAVLLAAATIYWFVMTFGPWIDTEIRIVHFQGKIIPFGTLFVSYKDFGFDDEGIFITNYLIPQFKRLTIIFCYALIWGVLAPTVFKIKSFKQFLIPTISIILPLELIILLGFLFGFAAPVDFYDTGCYILLALGTALGYNIQKGISKLHEERSTRK